MTEIQSKNCLKKKKVCIASLWCALKTLQMQGMPGKETSAVDIKMTGPVRVRTATHHVLPRRKDS